MIININLFITQLISSDKIYSRGFFHLNLNLQLHLQRHRQRTQKLKNYRLITPTSMVYDCTQTLKFFILTDQRLRLKGVGCKIFYRISNEYVTQHLLEQSAIIDLMTLNYITLQMRGLGPVLCVYLKEPKSATTTFHSASENVEKQKQEKSQLFVFPFRSSQCMLKICQT